MSPTHPGLDRVWALLQDSDVPFMVHGSGILFQREGFKNNGKALDAGPLGGNEDIRSKE